MSAASRDGQVERRARLGRGLACAGLLALVGFELVWLADVARHLTLDYFDAFEYLGNARVLAHGDRTDLAVSYQWRRPLLVPWLQSWLYPDGHGVDDALEALRRAHGLAWALSLAALVSLFVHLRRFHGAVFAALGVFLLAANPMFLHMVPFALVDVPSLLFTLLALAAFLRAREGSRGWGLAWCLALTAAMLTKYNLLLLVPVFVAAETVAPAAGRGLRARLASGRLWWPLVGACGLWLAAHAALRIALEGASQEAFAAPLRMLFGEVDLLSSLPWDDPWSEYLQEVAQVSPALVLAAAVAGGVLAVRGGSAADRLHLLWLAAFGLAMSGLVVSKTSRYFLPALPSLVYLELRGLRWATARLAEEAGRRWPARRPWIVAGGLGVGTLLVCGLPLQQALHQLRHFDDPVYRSPFLRELSLAVADVLPEGQAFHWHGRLYTLVPEERVFFPHDETFTFYHFGPPSLRALVNRPFVLWPREVPIDAAELVARLPADGLVVQSLPRLYLTADAARMPASLPPLRLGRIERRTLARAGDGSRYESGGTRVELVEDEGGWALPGVPGRGWQVLVRHADGRVAPASEPLAELPQTLELVRVRWRSVSP